MVNMSDALVKECPQKCSIRLPETPATPGRPFGRIGVLGGKKRQLFGNQQYDSFEAYLNSVNLRYSTIQLLENPGYSGPRLGISPFAIISDNIIIHS